MPRDLYPSHTGRFGGLNRQLMIARERMRDFRRRSAYGSGYGERGFRQSRHYGGGRDDDFQQMPEGVAGEEFTPEAYESTPMWADAEQGLHDILKDPPKFVGQPGDDPEMLAKQEHWQMINAPGVLQGRERNTAVLEAARIGAGGKVGQREEKEFQNAMAIVKGKEKVLNDMKKANASKPNTYSKEDLQTALEAYNGALRAAHKKGEKAGWEGLAESYPEIAPSGLTKATQADVDRKQAAAAAAKKRQAAPAMDPYGNIGMSELGLPDIFPGGIPDVKAVELLHRTGGELDRLLELGEKKGGINKETYDEKVTAITKPKIASERAAIADKVLRNTPAMDNLQEFYREQQPPAQLPQSMTGMAGEQAEGAAAGLPGSDIPGGPTAAFPSPEEGLLGDEERMPGGMPNFLQRGGGDFGEPPFGAGGPQQPPPQQPLPPQPAPQEGKFSQLPPMEEIGKVPRSFTRRRIPSRGTTVREE